ncbi:ZYRO0A04356p [Zygosaccharomyces rouxii]|uniref:ZYRO0A04356p n=1 Tax=Zygosaccharomyces rouxii (strain ATCC 2623 / CBS 732 / NBRC 1130 / NCYC 568 / NRRL Y-229) TaxID=559307 RepID=C5DPL6_ZYGRC|nr:uncharacterized protein ZYRO0A04356g [Zygosaccharomyces rouxii]KAH9198853.1 hypothetical protein LQ764DRAFT_235826 [Zygosaccharomyces rouxii]CAR25627.1 ZYRO0A04356p [Zygosaccharomyces rouxii]
MAKQKNTPKATNKFRYASFKDKIDDLKIEPVRNLATRAHDYVETSHFFASFEHWREINLSSSFTSFAGDVENIVQTLPQILYHEETILSTLLHYIDRHEPLSLQPLLDLLAQFCHDLGPDFLKFYERSVNSMVSLLEAAVSFESSDVFEWTFNCLAYIFKYLSRYLTEDLVPTFNLLFPLLSHSKTYLSRFSAEAMSFLIRKSNLKNLVGFVSFAFKKLVEVEEANFYDGLLALFTEALVSTQEALHSKCRSILDIFIGEALATSSDRSGSLLCDLWINLARHASFDNLQPVFESVVNKLQNVIDANNMNQATKIITTISFAESGKKVGNWTSVVELVKVIISQKDRSKLSPQTLAFLFMVLLRNCDIKNLTHFHKKLYEFYLDEYPDYFTGFFKASVDFTADRVYSFNGNRYLQQYLNKHWSTHQEQISLFLLQSSDDSDANRKLVVKTPDEFARSILESLKVYGKHISDDGLFEVCQGSILLSRSQEKNEDVLIPVLENILNASSPVTDFKKDVLGYVLDALQPSDQETHYQLLNDTLQQLESYRDSLVFIKSLNKYLLGLGKGPKLGKYLSGLDDYIRILSENLTLPDKALRYETLKLITTLMEVQEKEVPQLLNDCKIIEEIPLTLLNARDLSIRIRNMGSTFAKVESGSIITSLFFKFLFGLLTIRFSPVWEGVYEVISNAYGKDQQLVWDLIKRFLDAPDDHHCLTYYDDFMVGEADIDRWNVRAVRLHEILESFSNTWSGYCFSKSTIVETMKARRANLDYPGQLRNQTLKLMLLVPQFVERHSRDIIPYLFNQDESTEIFGLQEEKRGDLGSAARWTEADRNLLLKVIGKFKNMKSIYRFQEVHDRLMLLLGSRNTEVQKLAFEALLGYHDSVLTKYRDNLRNLLDDTLFKDELLNLISTGDSKLIEDQDEPQLMPYVVRIFFGRAQTPGTSGIKKGRKHAVISMLPNLRDEYIVEFLKLGSGKFNYQYFFENGRIIEDSEVTATTLRRMLGFVNIVDYALGVLASGYPKVMATTVRPLIYTIHMSYHVSNVEEKEPYMAKLAANLRQQSMKCLNNLFQYLGTSSVLNEFIEEICDIVVMPRIEKFENENLQQPSSTLRMISSWSTVGELYPFLYFNDYASPSAMMRVLSNPNAKESVVGVILEAANNIVTNPVNTDEYADLVTIVAANCLRVLPTLYKKITNPEIVSTSIDLLLNLVYAGYLQDNETRKYLVDSFNHIIRDAFKGVSKKDVIKVLQVLAALLKDYDCDWDDVKDLFEAVSGLHAKYSEKQLKEPLNDVFASFACRFPDLQKLSNLLSDLNSFSSKHMLEYDFPRILSAFKQFHEVGYREYSEKQWLPILFTCMLYINDEEELAIRTNASHTFCKFFDYLNEKPSPDAADEAVKILKRLILPHLRSGLRRTSEVIQAEHISVLSYIVSTGKYFTDLDDLRVLLYNGDVEANFFVNVVHIQLHRRLRAVRRLREHGHELSGSSISNYLIPIVEHYVFSKEEKFRNIGNEVLVTIGVLANFLSWSQYKGLLRRYIYFLKSRPDNLKESVNLITQLSSALKNSLCYCRHKFNSEVVLKKFPIELEEPDNFVTEEIYPKLTSVLQVRDNETAVARIPLSEALVNFVIGLDEVKLVSLLPGTLTSLCQILRSRSEELRDAVRKTLAEVSKILGAEYLPFILKELISALRRGSQVHVLSFTVHHVLKTLEAALKPSDLDNSSQLLVNVIMEDIFGFAGEEKESDNYHTTMKEIKVSRSYDTAEMLTSNISLPFFYTVLNPVKALLLERMNLKSQNKLNELLRKYALGLNRNVQAASTEVLGLCYEIFEQSETVKKHTKSNRPLVSENEEFFLINLNAKSGRVENETSLLNTTLQKFSLDLLRTVITRHRSLLEVKYLEGFMPLLKSCVTSENEDVLTIALRVLLVMVKLEFPESSESIFANCARRVLNIIKDSPSTSSEVCQVGLKFLSAVIRHKNIKLKDSALSYVLGRVLPDLNEPNKQGLAFNFVKALVYKHIQLPELYDVIDTVRQIMVTNHSKEIRDVSRSVYYQFLMEYDQSKGRLEKQFKFMVDNLQYPSQDGRQSVMELINLIVNKANSVLLSKLSSSFFVALANVFFNDDAPRCREMASLLLSKLLSKLDPESLTTVEKYITAWLKQVQNVTFMNLGLRVYKVYLTSIGLEHNAALDELAMNRVKTIISNTDVGSESQWDLVYSALNLFIAYVERSEKSFGVAFRITWDKVIGCILYPHLWVRQSASRLVNLLVNNLDKFEKKFTDLEVQNVVSRTMRQLGAPTVPESLAAISVKTLMKVAMRWKENNVPFVLKESDNAQEVHYSSALDYMIVRAGAIIRSEENPADSFMSKKSCIQLLALLVQILDENQLVEESEKIIMSLFNYLEQGAGDGLNEEQQELGNLAQECLQILESKISVSDFTQAYANVKHNVLTRRQERKAKRAVLAVKAPDVAAQKKIKKHVRSREKRKHERDEHGFYQRKNKKKRM